MAVSPEFVREKMVVERSPKDKGWIMTLTVRAYDNGHVTVNGVEGGPNNQGDPLRWAEAYMFMSQCMFELCKLQEKERKEKVAAAE